MSPEELVANWNQEYPFGYGCFVVYDDGSEHAHITHGAAFLNSNSVPTVHVCCIGNVPLDRVKMDY